ncbi:hypothetical protein M9H77_18896 [Catharanthus roseus]|uniref:Uncharacterized protein n=1 Tax=Catharanthus roseus TaxID=4058 RepID=A0ACC0B8W5_CATRO|nr:hypothetical protein M9H77_18896 [Catharanthus roseus]
MKKTRTAVVLLHTVPVLYNCYENQVDAFVEKALEEPSDNMQSLMQRLNFGKVLIKERTWDVVWCAIEQNVLEHDVAKFAEFQLSI